MRKIMSSCPILIALFLIGTCGASAQDLLNPPKLPNIDTSSVILRNEAPCFLRGWNWSSPGRKLDEACHINAYHGMYFESPDIAPSMRLMLKLRLGIIEGRNSTHLFNGHSLFLEPTLKVDSTPDFKPAIGDVNGMAFGFLYRNFDVGEIGKGDDVGRYVLKAHKIKGKAQIVLDSVWDGTILHWLDYDGDDNGYGFPIGRTNSVNINSQGDRDTFHILNGKQYYLTINLRALDIEQIKAHPNDVVLTIKLPYELSHTDGSVKTYGVTQGFVKFDSIPAQDENRNREIRGSRGDLRGVYRELVASPHQPEAFEITGAMLLNSNGGSSITLSAFAFFDSDDTLTGGKFKTNPRFKPDWWQNRYRARDYITRINAQVVYHGNADVAIDYVALTTPRAREIFFGKYDDSVRAAVDVALLEVSKNAANPKICRFYAADEFLPSEWAVNRYYNMLLDTLATVETFVSSNSPTLFPYATGIKEFWNGSSFSPSRETAAPYIKQGRSDTSEKTLGMPFGYLGNTYTHPLWGIPAFNPASSGYETFLWGTYRSFPFPDSLYDRIIWNEPPFNFNMGFQYTLERFLYQNYFKKNGLIFGSTPWIANHWVQFDPVFFGISPKKLYFGAGRPKTAEELSLSFAYSMTLGAKGVIYWFKTTERTEDKGFMFPGLQSSWDPKFQDTLPVGDSLINCDAIGGDYINTINDPNHFHRFFDEKNYDFEALGVDKNHIYIGLKSARYAVEKNNQFCEANEKELLNLELQAWFGKGFIKIYTQRAVLPDSAIKKYVNINRIQTRPIDRSYYENDNKTGVDSGFYDITLLKYKDKPIESEFVIGVINRRTDPLIPLSTGDGVIYKFWATPELLDSCTNPAKAADTVYYQSLWRKRLGARQIKLRFACENASADSLNLIRITEMGADKKEIIERRDRGAAFYSTVDTTIRQNSDLEITMNPGEYKLLKAKVLTIKDTLSAKSTGDKLVLKLWPNPASDYLRITALLPRSLYVQREGATSSIILMIYDSKGSEVYRGETEPGQIKEIDLKGFSQGVYYLRAEEKPDTRYKSAEPIESGFTIVGR